MLSRKVLFAISITALVGGVVFLLPRTRATVASSNPASRDTTRISDLQQIQNDLAVYFNKCGYYPGIPQAGSVCGAFVAINSYDRMTAALLGSNLGIASVPNDPTTGMHYSYGPNAAER